ncbi:MAG TPA: DUF72 domain-containing protein [Candidatus Acidoferrales bacterium]|nr:DUF72 domain-containing protein [Candidatus Acidoferrales bacterium]
MTVPSIRIGTQGWSFDDWRGVFYPPGAKQEDRLPFYAQVFDTVELDTTFHHPPRATIVRSWDRHTPPHFRFAAKVPRAITHEGALRGVGERLDQFARSMEPLGGKLGPLLVQLPAEFTCTDSTRRDLAAFLAAAPSPVRLAVEFRHASWHEPATLEILRGAGAALAWTEWRELARRADVTADFLYLRWLGDRREIATYNRVQVDREDSFSSWRNDLQRVFPEVHEVFGYFNNHWAGHSPESANEMKRRLGLPFVEPRSAWTQRELF